MEKEKQQAIDAMNALGDMLMAVSKSLDRGDNLLDELKRRTTNAENFCRLLDGVAKINPANTALYIYQSTLEITKQVFGDNLSDEVICKAIESASYTMWRSLMGESKPLVTVERAERL